MFILMTLLLTGCNYDKNVIKETIETQTEMQAGESATETEEIVLQTETMDVETDNTEIESTEIESTETVNVEEIKQPEIPNLISMITERNSFADIVATKGGYKENLYIGSFLIDVDLDDNDEAFVYYFTDESSYSCDLWFVDNSDNATKLSERALMYDESELDGVYSYQYGKDVLVICNWVDSVTSGASDLFLFRNGKMASREETPFGDYSHGYKKILANGDVAVTQDYYGFLLEWDDEQKNTEAMQLGHAYIPYIFYYTDGKLKEYEAVEIDPDKEGYVWDQKPFEEKNPAKIRFLRRENNEIDVNIACEEDKTVSFSVYRYKISEDGKTLNFIEELDGTIGENMEDFSFQEQFIK